MTHHGIGKIRFFGWPNRCMAGRRGGSPSCCWEPSSPVGGGGAAWIRAAGISDDFQDFYFFLQSVGRKWKELGTRLLVLLLPILKAQARVLLAIDDSPTKRYGPCVQGAGIHHDPTPGPSGNAFCYGHVWVRLLKECRLS